MLKDRQFKATASELEDIVKGNQNLCFSSACLFLLIIIISNMI